jgi:hypothetical protein
MLSASNLVRDRLTAGAGAGAAVTMSVAARNPCAKRQDKRLEQQPSVPRAVTPAVGVGHTGSCCVPRWRKRRMAMEEKAMLSTLYPGPRVIFTAV